MDQVPTPGRIVLYKPTTDEIESITGYEPGNHVIIEWPAIVVWVFSETVVNLKVFGDAPKDFWKTNAVLGEVVGEWRWPPRV